MERTNPCLKVPKRDGQTALIAATRLKIVNDNLKVQSDRYSVYIPLTGKPNESVVNMIRKQVPSMQITKYMFGQKKKSLTLVELLRDNIPSYLLTKLPQSMDLVGDIAIVEISPELDKNKEDVGEAIIKVNKNVHTVLAKASAVSGTYRLRQFSVIAGEPRTETIHKEYGCRYHVDVSKAYFSPRLSHEHNRITNLVKEGETVVDFFSGVGPFAIQIAKNHKEVKVYAIDLNPEAFYFLEKNIKLNKVVDKVYPLLGNAEQIVEAKLLGIADRVIMNLPESAIQYVDAACRAIKSTGGIIHFYSFTDASSSIKDVEQRLVRTVERCGRRVEEILLRRQVRETAPYKQQVVLDSRIR